MEEANNPPRLTPPSLRQQLQATRRLRLLTTVTDTPTTETTTSLVYPVVGPGGAIVAEPEPDPADLVICGEGLVKIDELITDEDNGCRPETCAGERGANGQCLIIEDELLTEEEAAELLENAETGPLGRIRTRRMHPSLAWCLRRR